jgi:hypothetical protein
MKKPDAQESTRPDRERTEPVAPRGMRIKTHVRAGGGNGKGGSYFGNG